MKIFLIALVLLFGTILTAQQTVTFDLSTGKFNEQLSYIEKITIEGIPIKEGKKIDIIELRVSIKNKKIQKEITKKETELGQLEVKIESLNEKISKGLPAKDKSDKYAKLLVGRKAESEKLDSASKKDSSSYKAIDKEINEIKEKSLKEHKLNKDLALIEKAKLVDQINELNLKKNETSVIQKLVWKRQTEEEKFSITLTDLLQMEEDYKFEFELYSKNENQYPVDGIAAKIVDEIIEEIDSLGYMKDEKVITVIRSCLDSVNKAYFKNLKIYDAGKGINAENINFKNKDSLINEINNLTTFLREQEIKQKDIKANVESYIKILHTYQNGSALLKDHGDSLKFENLCINYDENDKTEYLKLFEKYNIDLDKAENLLDGIGKANLVIKHALEKAENDIKEQKRKIERLLAAELNKTYKKEYEVLYSVSSSGIKTELDATRTGTIYGIGGITLGDDVWELTQYVALNFRFGAYDNRLKGSDAYKSLLSRCSIMVGIATTSNLEYKGQKLSSTRLGFKPILGLSIEPIKHVNISGGVIAFVQDPVGADQSYSLTKFRPIFSIAFDFNVVNYLITKNK